MTKVLSRKNIFLLFLAVFLFWFLRGLFPNPNTIIFSHKDLLAVPWPTELTFAGERVPLEEPTVREAWEKEFLINLDQDYQNLLYLKRTAKYFPYIEAELTERGLPQDLKYLAVAESGLLETSTSSAGAAGLWQFVTGTARDQGLTVNSSVDERRHFEKSTDAALDYLTFLEEKFNNWTLAAAAYNVGFGSLSTSLAEQGVDNYYALYLNSETSRYLFRILAIKEIMEHPAQYGYDLNIEDYFIWPSYSYFTVSSIDDLATWAREKNTNLRLLKFMNPWLIGDSLPEGTWRLKLAE